jgi:hypothetical protein
MLNQLYLKHLSYYLKNKKAFNVFEEGVMNARSIRATTNASLDEKYMHSKIEGEKASKIEFAKKL